MESGSLGSVEGRVAPSTHRRGCTGQIVSHSACSLSAAGRGLRHTRLNTLNSVHQSTFLDVADERVGGRDVGSLVWSGCEVGQRRSGRLRGSGVAASVHFIFNRHREGVKVGYRLLEIALRP